jgi:hypothetical protein
MKDRLVRKAAAATLVLASTALGFLTVADAQSGSSASPIHANRIRFVYPDAPETSNAPFPPNADKAAVHSALRTVMVSVHGHAMTMGQYLRSVHMDPGKVVTIKVAGDSAAVYTYR